MCSNEDTTERPWRFWLTPDCEAVQAEIMELANALAIPGGPEDEPRRLEFLPQVRRVRQHLADHVEMIENPAGLFDAIAVGAAPLTSHVMTLCQEHADIDRQLEELERRLEGQGGKVASTAGPAVDAEVIHGAAVALLNLLRRHQYSASDLARSAGEAAAGDGADGG